MFEKLKLKAEVLESKFRCLPFPAKVIPILMLAIALIIRLFAGSTEIFYSIIAGAGLFPSPFFYWLGYLARLILAGYLLGLSLCERTIYENRTKVIICTCIAAFLLLSEYKILFSSLKLFLSVVISFITAALGAISYFVQEKCPRNYFFPCVLFVILEAFHFAALVTVIVCL